jgi:hypothetical protein
MLHFGMQVCFQVCMKLKPHKCEARTAYVNNLEVYAGTHPTDQEHSISFSVLHRICEPVKYQRYTVYMYRWFTSSLVIFDYLVSWDSKG